MEALKEKLQVKNTKTKHKDIKRLLLKGEIFFPQGSVLKLFSQKSAVAQHRNKSFIYIVLGSCFAEFLFIYNFSIKFK